MAKPNDSRRQEESLHKKSNSISKSQENGQVGRDDRESTVSKAKTSTSLSEPVSGSFNLLKILSIILSAVGILVSGYLLFAKLSGSDLVCGVSTCGIVNESSYAVFLGIPVSAWGLLFYLAALLLVVTNRITLFFALTLGGVLFSVYLTYVEFFVIHAWCQWCVLSAWLSFGLFVIGIVMFFRNSKCV